MMWLIIAMVLSLSLTSTMAFADPSAPKNPAKTSVLPQPPQRLLVRHRKGVGVELDLTGDGQWLLSFGVMAFARMEYINNIKDLSFGKDDHDFYTATRFRLRLGARVLHHVGAVATIQDARFWGNGLPQDGYVRFRSDTESVLAGQLFLGLSLFEGYVYLDRPLSLPLRLEVGRMVFEYGDGFVLGDPGFGVQGQSLDAARLRLFLNRWRVDLFWAKLRATVANQPSPTCTQDCIFEGDDLGGLYATWQPSSQQSLDLYGLFYLKAPGTGEAPIHSYIWIMGARWAYKAGGLKTSIELIAETGSAQQQAMFAVGGLAKLRYQFQVAARPFVGVQILAGSGDSQSQDGLQTAFLPLFSRRRRFYGQLNMFATTNLFQPMIEFGIQPHPTLTISANARQSFMLDPRAALRNGGHAVVAQQADGQHSVLGFELDASVAWRPYPGVLFDLVGGIFVPGAGDAIPQFLDKDGQRLFGDDPAMLLYLRTWVSF